jgi:hypothetical protein
VLMILVVIPLGIAFFTTTMGAATNGAGAPEFPY